MIRYPNITGKTDAQKLEQMRSYLHQLVDELNYQLDRTGILTSDYASTANDIAKAVEKKNDPVSNFNDIKALIIKSADIVDAYYTEINKKLEGQYVAESEFGTFKETTDAQLTASSDRIEVALTKQETIEQDMDELERTMRSEISQTADSIKLEVIDGTPGNTATIKLTVGNNVYSGQIDMTGLVTFNSLETAGQTVINGSNITTGEILADLIKAGVIKSVDGTSVVIDLDNGQVSLKGTIRTEEEADEEGGLNVSQVTPKAVSCVLRVPGSSGGYYIYSTGMSGKGVKVVGNDDIVSQLRSNYLEIRPDIVRDDYDDYSATMKVNPDGLISKINLTSKASATPLEIASYNGNNYIHGLSAPTADSHAANKGYVDGLIDSAFNEIDAADSAMKEYVDDCTYGYTYINCSAVASNTESPVSGMPYYAILQPDYSGLSGTPIATSLIMLGNDNTQSSAATPVTSVMLGNMTRNGSIIHNILAFSTGYQTVRATIGVWYKRN